jgi:CubicO group peptidase (beta-lactamase class C family)
MKQVDVPGLSIAVIYNGDLVWERGFGVNKIGTEDSVTENTVFEAGSLSKPVFAYAVLKLVDTGLFDLDKQLTDYLPDSYISDEKVNQITARMVLSHTSGLPLWWPEENELQIHFTPGERFSYSSEAFVYLQNIVEYITNQSLELFVEKQVFEPLEMQNSSFIWKDSFEKNIAWGHNIFAVPEEPWRRNIANAASSLYTTAEDYAKFMAAIIKGVGLKQNTNQQMFNSQIQVNPNCLVCLENESSILSESISWGLGWGLEKTSDTNVFWHWGDNMLVSGYCAGSLSKKTGVVFFANSSNGLTMRDKIVATVIDGEHPAFKWLHYDQHDSPATIFRQTVLKEGTESGFGIYHDLKSKSNADAGFISENSLNDLGYMLLQLNRIDEAIEVFRLNVEENPASWNVYDSLAEAYATNGDNTRAVNYYNIALNKVEDQNHKKRIEENIKELKK